MTKKIINQPVQVSAVTFDGQFMRCAAAYGGDSALELHYSSEGYTVVMVEQNFRFAAPLADRFYVMEHGRIVERFEASELQAKMPVLNQLLGV